MTPKNRVALGTFPLADVFPKVTPAKANNIKLPQKTLNQIDSAYHQLESQIQKAYGQSIREFRGLNDKFY